MEIIQTYAITQFTPREFQEVLSVRGVRLVLAAPDHQEMNSGVEFTWQTLQTISHSIMLHTRVSDEYIHFSIMYTTDNIVSILQIKHLVNKDGEPSTPHKLETGKKHSLPKPRVLFC